MRFPELLIEAIRQSEIPLRFEPGAEESVAAPVTGLLKAWLESHDPKQWNTDFEAGQKALIRQLLEELEGAAELPG
jgi:hypothetical protein